MDVAYAGDDTPADSRVLRMLARKFDHRVNGIDRLYRVAGLSQRDAGQTRAAADFQNGPFS